MSEACERAGCPLPMRRRSESLVRRLHRAFAAWRARAGDAAVGRRPRLPSRGAIRAIVLGDWSSETLWPPT
jgi:hypothetical protein